MNVPVLHQPDLTKTYTIEMDFSVEYALMQTEDYGLMHPLRKHTNFSFTVEFRYKYVCASNMSQLETNNKGNNFINLDMGYGNVVTDSKARPSFHYRNFSAKKPPLCQPFHRKQPSHLSPCLNTSAANSMRPIPLTIIT